MQNLGKASEIIHKICTTGHQVKQRSNKLDFKKKEKKRKKRRSHFLMSVNAETHCWCAVRNQFEYKNHVTTRGHDSYLYLLCALKLECGGRLKCIDQLTTWRSVSKRLFSFLLKSSTDKFSSSHGPYTTFELEYFWALLRNLWRHGI